MSLLWIVVIIALVLALGGGTYGHSVGWGYWGWSPFGLIVVVLLILLLFGWLVTGATRVSQWLLDGRIPAILQSDSYASMALAVLVAIYVYRALRAYLCYPRIGCAILSAWMLAGLFWLLQLYRLLLFFVTVYALH